MSYLDVNGQRLNDQILDEWIDIIDQIPPATEMEGELVSILKDVIEGTRLMLRDLTAKERIIKNYAQRLDAIAANAEAYAAHVVACHASGKPPASYDEWYLYEVVLKYRDRQSGAAGVPSSNS